MLSILFGIALVQKLSAPPQGRVGAASSPPAVSSRPAVSTPVAPAPDTSPLRKILFQYRNSRPFQVELIGDFNDWQPGKHVMARGMDHMWRVTVPLAPGRFGYQFVVDGKTIRDPANRRFQKDPRRGLLSIVEVKPKSR